MENLKLKDSGQGEEHRGNQLSLLRVQNNQLIRGQVEDD